VSSPSSQIATKVSPCTATSSSPPSRVHHRGAPDAERAERASHRLAPGAGEHADDLVADVRRVGQRAEQVEDRAGAELLARPRGVAGRSVEPGREREADAGDLDRRVTAAGSAVDADASTSSTSAEPQRDDRRIGCRARDHRHRTRR